ncbi:unnamed protein product [Urochloa humidicola]
MALRSLVVMLKALPRRMPSSGAFAPKGNLSSKISARLTDPTISGSVEETTLSKIRSHLVERAKLDVENSLRQVRAHNMKMVLMSIVSIGAVKSFYNHVEGPV